MFNRLRKILSGIAILAVAGVVAVLLWLGSPGKYRTLLETHVAAVTGHELQVAGAIELDLLPVARLALEDARLRNPAFPQELASAGRIEMVVDRGDLLRGKLTIGEVRIEDFQVNAFVDAAGDSIWSATASTGGNSGESAGELPAGPAAGADGPIFSEEVLPARIVASNGRLDYQDLGRSQRMMLKNLGLELNGLNLQGETFSAISDFELEWFDASDQRIREMPVGLWGDIAADGESGKLFIADLGVFSPPVLLEGRIEVSDFRGNPRYEANLASGEFDARVLLQNLGWLPEPEPAPLSVPDGDVDEGLHTALAFEVTGDINGLAASAAVSSSAEPLLEAETEIRFANDLSPTNVRYEMDIGELDFDALLHSEAASSADSSSLPQAVAPKPRRELPGLENLNLSGSISADALGLGPLRLENLVVYTNIENQVLDMEAPPVAALGGNISANLRWNARSGDLASEFHGEELAIADIAPLITRLDVLTGRLRIDGLLSANGRSTTELLEDLSGHTSFVVSENLVNIGLIKQIFTSIAALSPTGETIQQWPDLIRFAEVSGDLALDGGLGSEHGFNLRMDNLSAAGTGVVDLQEERFDYEILLTMLGEPLIQTIPVDNSYQNLSWPVECSASFAAELVQFCRPDFTAVRQIFSRIGDNAGGN